VAEGRVAITIDQYLERARARLDRLTPADAWSAGRDGGLIVDIRGEGQVAAGGEVPGAVWIARNVLEWRAAPGSPHADPRIAACRGPLILICQQGYQSSVAAATLQDLGRAGATDVVGGFERWVRDGLPVVPVPA
jgi:rhodanese-related sulfurtransferase